MILTNHLGYERLGPKRAVVQGREGDLVTACALEGGEGGRVPTDAPAFVGRVARWRDWVYWSVDFSGEQREGRFRLVCTTGAGEVRSFPFLVEQDLLERHTLSDVLYYFKGQRASGLLDLADHALPLEDRPDVRVDAHGGWYDATGDYGKHLSHLSFSTYFNPQQLSLTAWGLLETTALLERRGNPAFRQYLRRLLDEAAWGADYLVRVKVPGGSFYRSVSAPGPGKRPEDRRIGRDAQAFAIKTTEGQPSFRTAPGRTETAEYQSSFRAGGGVAIAALARAAAMADQGRAEQRLPARRRGGVGLPREEQRVAHQRRAREHRRRLLRPARGDRALPGHAQAGVQGSRGRTGLAASWPVSHRARGPTGARTTRLAPSSTPPTPGFRVTSLLAYLEVADEGRRKDVLQAVRASLEWELAVTGEVANPFGYARQLVQTTAGVRETRFFFPHDTETAPWWQGEDARLASLAFAARRALPHFADDPAFAARLRRYAQDQLDWILGRNPFDASLLQGTGRNNPEYLFFGSYEYTNAPGGIVNGITAGFRDPQGIDFNLPHGVTGADNDWRWGEQWLPHATWYLLAVAAGSAAPDAPPPPPDGRAIIAYVFSKETGIDPKQIAADKLTHINYAFANIKDGRVVEGFARDGENFKVLTGLRRVNPAPEDPGLGRRLDVVGRVLGRGRSPRRAGGVSSRAPCDFVRRPRPRRLRRRLGVSRPARRRQRPPARGQARTSPR